MDTREKILDTLSKLNVSQLDVMKDKKLLKLREADKNYFIARDKELDLKYNKRKKLLNEGNSHSKIDQLFKSDEELFYLKKKILALGALRKIISLELKLLDSAYWRAKQ